MNAEAPTNPQATKVGGRVQRGVSRAIERAGILSPRLLFTTSGSLAGAMLATSVLGAAFWWLAAQLFSPHAVGVAAGSVSAMTFLGAIAVLGTGSLLLREIPRREREAASLISTAAAVATVCGVVLGVGFAVLAPTLNPELESLASGPGPVILFALGVVLTATGTVFDHALLGLLRAPMQLLRNIVFAVAKLALLAPAAILLAAHSGTLIYAVWATGAAVSLAVVAALFRTSIRPSPSWHLTRELARSALLHFALNTALVLPTLLMPVLVALMAPPVVAAQFYIAWMLASVSFYVPVALAQSLYAIGGRATDRLWEHARTTVSLSIGAGALAALGALLLAGPVLGLFGPTYGAAAGAATVMVAIAMPLAIKDHYQIISRIRGRPGQAAVVCGIGGVLEVGGGVVGFLASGIDGLAIGWLAAIVVEALILAPVTYRAARASLDA